jgi:hypothetical protein
LILGGYRRKNTQDLIKHENYKHILEISTKDPKLITGNAIRSEVTAKPEAPPSTVNCTTGDYATWSASDEQCRQGADEGPPKEEVEEKLPWQTRLHEGRHST